ncbi:MAG: Rpn family recombination-promoting nuclease/putative transposase [Candidatus Tectimicrobiota bacterium]
MQRQVGALIRARRLSPAGQLPPVLPIVLYHGRRPWTAPRDLGTLIDDGPVALRRYQPHVRYTLLEERRYTEAELAPLHNLVAAMMRLENSRVPADISTVLTALSNWLQAPEDTSLRRAFVTWLVRVLLPARLPGMTMPEVHTLTEVSTMLAERVLEWTEQWKQEGRREGRQEGQLQEARAMLLDAIRTRFRSAPRDITAAIRRVESRETLHALLRQLLTGATLEALREALHRSPPAQRSVR